MGSKADGRLSARAAWERPGGDDEGSWMARRVFVLLVLASALGLTAAGGLLARSGATATATRQIAQDPPRHEGHRARPARRFDVALAGTPEKWTARPGIHNRRPNVLIILVDDQPAQPATYEVMPSTMRLFRAGGTWFPNAVVTTPLCCPSRASIFSGRFAHNHGVETNYDALALNTRHTMQATLQGVGYQTGLVGKYLNGGGTPAHFDRYARFIAPGYYLKKYEVNGRIVEPRAYSTSFIERKALKFLDDFEKDDAAPWFLQVSPYAPHTPATPEPKYANAPVPGWAVTPAQVGDDGRDKRALTRHHRAGYPQWIDDFRTKQLRSLMSVDDLVRHVYRRLRALGEERNTLAFFLSDNGLFWHEHGLIPIKKLPYNEAVRVPFFVRWPNARDRLPAGGIDARIVANVDIAPTVYEAAGVVPDYVVDGRSIFTSERDHMFIEYLPREGTDIPQWLSLWTPSWAYIRYDEDGTYGREFYTENDPWQLESIYGDAYSGNELANEAEADELIDRYARCVGEDCP